MAALGGAQYVAGKAVPAIADGVRSGVDYTTTKAKQLVGNAGELR